MSQDEEQINLEAAGQEIAEPPAVIDLDEPAGQEAAVTLEEADKPAAAITLEPPAAITEPESDEDADPLHIGNLVMIASGKLGIITGRVTFRSLTLVRITPQ